MLKSLNKTLVNKAVEEIHLLRTVVKYISDDILKHTLCKHHIVLKVCKAYLRLNHPELCSMSCCIRVLSPECRTKGIYVLECKGKGLNVKLSRNCKVCRMTIEILAVIYLSVLCKRKIVHIKSCYLEHLSCALTVTSGNNGSMNIYEIPLLEELMNGICSHTSHPEYGLEGVGSGTKVGNCTEVFEAVTFLLKRIISC